MSPTARFLGIDHVLIAMPAGGEERARAFYSGVLGMTEVPKPAPLAGRGGAWFTAGSVALHLGVEAEFRPARKAHPALLVDDLAALLDRCRAARCELEPQPALAGYERMHIFDPFGNRIELMQRVDAR